MYSAYMKKQQNSKSLFPLSVHHLFIKKIQRFKCLQEFLDVNKPGCYQLVYSYQDGRLSGHAPLTVVVTERQG